LPLVATGGLGSLRGITGSGSMSTAFELGPGADNHASIALSGTFAALKPVLSIGAPHAFWGSTIRYLGHNLSVTIPVGNAGPPTTVGDAFAVTISSATLAGVGGASSGIPAALGEIQSGNGSGATVIFHGPTPGKKYNLTVTVTSRDALGDPDATVSSTSTITTPLTP
jgi:hypothetical protein